MDSELIDDIIVELALYVEKNLLDKVENHKTVSKAITLDTYNCKNKLSMETLNEILGYVSFHEPVEKAEKLATKNRNRFRIVGDLTGKFRFILEPSNLKVVK